ncbi:MAG: aldolase/citrate lyase family protein [Defluviitaleaceae bacterium]|nr:aldolase/citrate lyase family protein [Defluviitaleaceae bacterium]
MINRPIDKLNIKLKYGTPIIGTHVSLAEHCITEVMGETGFEFVWIDWEHSAMDRRDVQNHLIAARAAGIAAFVRVPWNDPVLVKPILEMGPDGVVFPMIRTAEEARAAVASCLYPPKGIRGYGPRRANNYGAMSGDEYLRQVETSFWKIMQIEHVDAVKNLDEILTVDGVDTIVVGPNDLSGSAGLLTQTRHPEVLALLDEIAEKCRDHKKPFGVSLGFAKETIEDWKRRGCAWIACGGDTGYLYEGAVGTYKNVKEIMNG